MFRLRVLVFTVVLAAALIHAAGAQQPVTGQRIGFLGSSVLLEIFRTAIADLGYQEGRDILIDRGWPEENRLDRLPEEAAALIKLKPKVIVTVGATATRAAKAATTEIPIVFAVVIDPASFRGGNVTGFSTFDPEQAKKQLSILQETIPGLARVALLGDAQAAPILFQENEDAARTLGLKDERRESAQPRLRGSDRGGPKGRFGSDRGDFHPGNHAQSKADRATGGQVWPSYAGPKRPRGFRRPD
jgi:putative ABC transport system substrate-binding protein